MSKLMWVLGILLAAAGVALALMTTYSPGKMQAYGLLPDTAAILFVGGILSLGLGGVIDALLRGSRMVAPEVKTTITTVRDKPLVEEEDTAVKLPVGFGRKAAEATAATAAVAAAGGAMMSNTGSTVTQFTKSSVSDTIAALDEAKADIKKALGGMDDLSATQDDQPVVPVHASETVIASTIISVPATMEVDDPEADDELYVVEEKIIRGRPARILSDETVEAETDEGWMRFENLEHLNEYIDSTEEPDA
jgi:hypothetical protein